MSQLYILSFVTNCLKKISHFEFLGFVTTWVLWIKKKHNMSFWSLSQFKIFCFVTILVIEFFFQNLSFWILSQLQYLSFVIIWVLEFYHKLSFGALSHFEFCHYWIFFSFPINLKKDIISSFITLNILFYFESFITLFCGNISYFVTLNLKCHLIFCYISYFVVAINFSIFFFFVLSYLQKNKFYILS